MRKTNFISVTFAVAVLTFGGRIVSHADFIDKFYSSKVADSDTIRHFWNQATYEVHADKGSRVLKSPGRLMLSYSGDLTLESGPRLFTGQRSMFNFFAHPVSVTLTAPANSTLTPIKSSPSSNENARRGAYTYIGFTDKPGPNLVGGANRIMLQLSDRNILKFSIVGPTSNLLYTTGVWDIPPDARVKKLTIYLDGSDEVHDNFLFNFGVQYATSNGGIVNSSRCLVPWNLGYGKEGDKNGLSQAQLDSIKASYSGVGASFQIELLNLPS